MLPPPGEQAAIATHDAPGDLAAVDGSVAYFVDDAHTVHPVRFLSVSHQGHLCYAWDGEIWVRPAGATGSRKLAVSVALPPGCSTVGLAVLRSTIHGDTVNAPLLVTA